MKYILLINVKMPAILTFIDRINDLPSFDEFDRDNALILDILMFNTFKSEHINSFITKTRPCNIQQYFTAVKMFIFR